MALPKNILTAKFKKYYDYLVQGLIDVERPSVTSSEVKETLMEDSEFKKEYEKLNSHTWDDARAELFTPEEIAESDLRVLQLGNCK